MKKFNSIFWGIIIILVGILWFGNAFDFWKFDIFFDGWWTLFIIIPSIYALFKKEVFSSIFGLVMGILLFLAAQEIIKWKNVLQALFPLILILVGLTLIFKPKIKTIKKGDKKVSEYVGIFSGTKEMITDAFNGASIVSVFGEVNLDLTKAVIREDIVVECVSIFGGIVLNLPNDVKVKTEGVPIFGGVSNKVTSKDGHTVTINYVTVFAGIDIK